MGKEKIELEIYYLVFLVNGLWPFLITNANKITIALAMVGVGKIDILTQILHFQNFQTIFWLLGMQFHFHIHNFMHISEEFLDNFFNHLFSWFTILYYSLKIF
jgi:hypothetical protein